MKRSTQIENGQGNENKKRKIIPTSKTKSSKSRHPQMNEISLRFSDLAKRIFNKLNHENLSKCKNVSRSWSSFRNQDVLFLKRMIKKYTNNISEFKEAWRCVMTKTGLENIRILAMAIKHFLSIHPSKCEIEQGECKHRTVSFSPLHLAVESGQL